MYELCMETQHFLAEHGTKKVFSSFHEEMEDRRKTEAKHKSEGESITNTLERLPSHIEQTLKTVHMVKDLKINPCSCIELNSCSAKTIKL